MRALACPGEEMARMRPHRISAHRSFQGADGVCHAWIPPQECCSVTSNASAPALIGPRV